MIETSQLQTILTVARSGSFSKAAQDLNVTQSAISQSVKNLENKVGVKLFKRSGRQVVLTTEGERLYHLASDYLEQMDQTLQIIRDNKNTMTGRVRIGTHSGLGKSWVAHAMVDFASKFPDLNVDVRLSYAKNLVAQFEQFQLDCLVLPEGDLPTSGERVNIGSEKLGLVFPKNADFPINSKTTLEELAQYPLIMFEEMESLFFNWCRSHYGKIPSKMRKRLVVNSHGSILYGVSKGVGIAVVPTHVLNRSYYKQKIATLGPDFEVANGKLYFVYHEETKDLLRMRKLIEEFLLPSDDNPLSFV